MLVHPLLAMDLNGIPLFSMLRSRIGYISERERLISQNVANASTPGYTPQDPKPFTVKASGHGASGGTLAMAPVTQSITNPAHLTGTVPAKSPDNFASVTSPDSETTLDGNQVVLEEQMMKMTEARTDYDAAIGFYQKALEMLQMAVKKPGG